MLRKKIVTIIGMAMLSAFTINGVSTFTNLIKPIVVQAEMSGKKTPTGYITSKVKLEDNFPKNDADLTIENLKKISIEVNPTDNPLMFSILIDSYIIAPHLNFLTDNIYHYGRIEKLPSGKEERVDEFIKILSLERGSSVNKVRATYTKVTFENNDNEDKWISRNQVSEYENKEVYDYLISEDKPVIPPVVEKPVVPVKPEVVKKGYNSTRLWGMDRYATSLSIAKEFNNGKFDNVVLASATDFPDALSGSVLASKNNAPILLVGKDKEKNRDMINHIKANLNKGGKVYVLGGKGAVSEDIVNELRSEGINNISRLGGIDRYETSYLIQKEMNVAKGTPVVIANSLTFADSLSISSVASNKGMPILLTNGTLDNTVIDAIKNIAPSQIYIVGGTGAVSSNVEATLKQYSNVTRIGGIDRYETSINIAKHFKQDTNSAAIAYGLDFPDALSGSVLAAKNNAPILLVNKDEDKRQKEYLDSTKIDKLYILGGSGVVTEETVNYLKK